MITILLAKLFTVPNDTKVKAITPETTALLPAVAPDQTADQMVEFPRISLATGAIEKATKSVTAGLNNVRLALAKLALTSMAELTLSSLRLHDPLNNCLTQFSRCLKLLCSCPLLP